MTVAILAYLQLASWNCYDWKEVQPQSGTKECSECRRMDECQLKSRTEDERACKNEGRNHDAPARQLTIGAHAQRRFRNRETDIYLAGPPRG